MLREHRGEDGAAEQSRICGDRPTVLFLERALHESVDELRHVLRGRRGGTIPQEVPKHSGGLGILQETPDANSKYDATAEDCAIVARQAIGKTFDIPRIFAEYGAQPRIEIHSRNQDFSPLVLHKPIRGCLLIVKALGGGQKG